MLIVFNK